jgi:hypothetical protein
VDAWFVGMSEVQVCVILLNTADVVPVKEKFLGG